MTGVNTGDTAWMITIPHQLFMAFQMMFAVITPALVVGAFAERMKFGAFLLFSLLGVALLWFGWFGFNAGSALGSGALAGLVCYVSVVVFKNKLGYDDSLDAFGVHGVGGMLGARAGREHRPRFDPAQ